MPPPLLRTKVYLLRIVVLSWCSSYGSTSHPVTHSDQTACQRAAESPTSPSQALCPKKLHKWMGAHLVRTVGEGDVKIFQGCKQSEEFVLGRGEEGLCWLNREIIVEIVYQIFHPKFVCRNQAKGIRRHIKQKRGGEEAKWQDLINVVLPLPVNTQQRPVSKGNRAEAKGVLQINFGKPCPFPMFMHQTYSIIHSYVVKGKLIFGNTIINTESLGADKCMIRHSLPDFLGTRPIPEQRSEGWGREG